MPGDNLDSQGQPLPSDAVKAATGLKGTLLSLIPIFGPAYHAHQLLKLADVRHQQDQNIAQNSTLVNQLHLNSQDQGLLPEDRDDAASLSAEAAMIKPGSPIPSDLQDRIGQHFQKSKVTRTLNERNAQSGMPSALTPPPQMQTMADNPNLSSAGGFLQLQPPPPPGAATGMLPQGSSQVSTAPGRPPVQPQSVAIDPMDVMGGGSPRAVAQVAGPYRELALSAGLSIPQTAMALNRLQQTTSKTLDQFTPTQLTEYLKTGIIPPVPITPIAKDTLGYQQGAKGTTVYPGIISPTPVAAGGGVAMPQTGLTPGVPSQPGTLTPPPPIGASSAPSSAGDSGGVTITQGPPAQLSEGEAKFVSAAQQIADKHKIPFDPAKNPRNPLAQIPTRYHKEVMALDAEQRADPVVRQQMMALRTLQEGNIAFQQKQELLKRVDASYNKSTSDLDKVSKPVDDALMRFGRLQDTLDQKTAAADPLIAPELLTVMAGGQGSGLRMNEAEISRIVGGRDAYESLKAKVMKWTPGSGLSVTDKQREQISDLLKVVHQKLKLKRAAIDEAMDRLRDSEDVGEHRGIVSNTRKRLTEIDEGNASGTLTAPPGGRPPLASFESK